jgi:hypothetical protein
MTGQFSMWMKLSRSFPGVSYVYRLWNVDSIDVAVEAVWCLRDQPNGLRTRGWKKHNAFSVFEVFVLNYQYERIL